MSMLLTLFSSYLSSSNSVLLFRFFHSGACPARSHPFSSSLPPQVWLDLRLSYLEASQSIRSVCDWVASCDSFL